VSRSLSNCCSLLPPTGSKNARNFPTKAFAPRNRDHKLTNSRWQTATCLPFPLECMFESKMASEWLNSALPLCTLLCMEKWQRRGRSVCFCYNFPLTTCPSSHVSSHDNRQPTALTQNCDVTNRLFRFLLSTPLHSQPSKRDDESKTAQSTRIRRTGQFVSRSWSFLRKINH
jgi:hypothetical protein